MYTYLVSVLSCTGSGVHKLDHHDLNRILDWLTQVQSLVVGVDDGETPPEVVPGALEDCLLVALAAIPSHFDEFQAIRMLWLVKFDPWLGVHLLQRRR